MKPAISKHLFNQRSSSKAVKFLFFLIFMAFFGLNYVNAQRTPIDINLIIDSSASLTNVKNEITTWVFARLDQILVDGDRVTVWSAGPVARVIYSGSINNTERDVVKRRIQEITPSGSNADFAGALREASETAARQQQNSGFCYTLLISTSPESLSSLLSGPQANLLRFSRVEEFNAWRALVVGLNLETRVRRAASAFFNN